MQISAAIAPVSIALALLLHAHSAAAESQAVATHGGTASTQRPDGEMPASPASGAAAAQAAANSTTVAPSAVVMTGATADSGSSDQRPSAAERISRLESSLEADQKRFDELKAKVAAPDSEYAQAETSFRDLDSQRTALQQRIAELEHAGKQDELAQSRTDVANLETKWNLAKERFDLAIGERKAMQESVATLQRKLESDRASLAKLKDAGEPQRLTAPPEGQPQPAQQVPVAPAPSSAPIEPVPQDHAAAAAPPTLPAATAEGTPVAVPSESPTTNVPPPAVEKSPILTEKVFKELAVASKVAEKNQALAKAAEDDALTIANRIEILQQDIGLQRQLREAARKSADNSDRTLSSLNEEFFRKLMAGESIDEIRIQIVEASNRLRANQAQAREISTRLDELQSQLAHLQAEKLAAAQALDQRREAAQQSQSVVEKLKNPFTLRNMLQWLIDHGPKIVTILAALAFFIWISRICEAQLVELTAKRGRRGSREERENRAKTLLGVFRNVANIGIVTGGGMMILDEVGVPVAPIIGGAAVLGLAVAFGAKPDQGLLRRLHGAAGTTVPGE